jgi:predicted DNA-binding protein (MmcQ/YjbR family)
MYDDADPLLRRVREICTELPEAIEFESHGRPNFRAGSRRVFAVYGAGHDRPHALIVRVDPDDEAGLRADSRFFVPPYYPDRLALDLSDQHVDWDEVSELVEASYRLVASARMNRALDVAGEDRPQDDGR